MADCLVALGDAQRGAGQHEEASESYAAALDILDRSAVPDPVRLADCLQALTSHCLELARYSEALRHARRALGVQLRLRDPGDPALVKARLGFAAALRSDGKPDSAEAQCRTVLAEIKAAGTGDESLIAEALLQSAALARERGDQPAARAQAQEAVSLLENRADPDDPRWPTALHELGIALRRLGNERAARDTLQLAFRLASREGRRTPAVAAILSSMATLDRARGDTAAAAAAFAEALTILDDTLPDGHPQQALVLRNLASLRNAGGRFLEAEQLYRRALGMLRAALGDDHPDVAAAHLGLGNALKALGRLADARQEYERAADIHLRAFGPDAPPLALDYHNLAALLLETDEPDRAMDLAGEAERIGEQHFRLIAQGVSEREALHYSAGRVSGTDIILTAAVRSESPVAWEQAWDLVVRSRAVVLEEIAQRRRFLALADEDPKVFGLSTRLEEASNELAHLVVQGRGVRTQEEYLRQLAETRSTKEQAERNLAAVSREFRAKQTLQEVGLAEVLDALPPGAGMVAWVRFNLLEREVREGREPPPEEGLPSYAAFVADGASRRIRLVHLGPAAQIDSLVAAWHEQAGSGLRAKGRAEAEEDYGEAGGALRRAVWDSAAVQVGNVERLFLVPDGSLNLVSFEVLPDEAGGFLLEHAPLFCVLSSERDMAAADRAAALGTGLLTAADPDYERMPSAEIEASGLRSAARGVACGKFKSLWFAPIPGTAAEQREVVQLWGELTAKGLSGAGRSGRDVHRLTGPEATELRFRRLALGREIIHVATHGFYLGAECGGDRASGGSAAWDELTVSGLVGESPLLLSGLAFAGANLREDAPAPADDGILTAEEITSLDLTGVDTVVLSACETGLGKVEAGEGVFGLRRAFQVAGVRSLVMTLWSIDDQATVAWMRAMFQHRLLENLPPARAARAASLDILRERRLRGETDHPFHWGAFLVTGGWK
jgi:tetratricopeptide (TPR) repeat protein